MGKKKDARAKAEAARTGWVRTLEQLLVARYVLRDDMDVWLDQMERLRDDCIAQAASPPLSPRAFRDILLAAVPPLERGQAQPVDDTTTWAEVATRLRTHFHHRPPTAFDRLPSEIVREILLLATIADIDLRLADPTRTRWAAPYQTTTITSALDYQRAHLDLRLVSHRWNELLGRPSDVAVRNISRAFALTKLLDRKHELARNIKRLVVCVRDTSKGRLKSCRRGEVIAELLARTPHLEELHLGGPLLDQTDAGFAPRVDGGPSRLDRILQGAMNLQSLTKFSLLARAISSRLLAFAQWPSLVELRLARCRNSAPVTTPVLSSIPTLLFRLHVLDMPMDELTCMRLFTSLEARGTLSSLTHLTTVFPDLLNLELSSPLVCADYTDAFRRVAPQLVNLCYSEGQHFVGLEDAFPTMVALKRLRLDEPTNRIDGPLSVPNLEHLEFAWIETASFGALFEPLTDKLCAGDELPATTLAMDVVYTGTRPLEFTVSGDRGVADDMYLEMEDTGWLYELLARLEVNVWSADRSKSCRIEEH